VGSEQWTVDSKSPLSDSLYCASLKGNFLQRLAVQTDYLRRCSRFAARC
jgi:hypothetical protein